MDLEQIVTSLFRSLLPVLARLSSVLVGLRSDVPYPAQQSQENIAVQLKDIHGVKTVRDIYTDTDSSLLCSSYAKEMSRRFS